MPKATQAIVQTLRRVPLFNELSEVELESLAQSITTVQCDTGQLVFTEGERGGDLIIVESGSVKILKTAPSGRHQLIAIERTGSSLGEVSLFDGGPYSATAIAAEPTVLLRLRGDRFQYLCSVHPELSFKVIRVLANRLRHLRRLVEELSFSTIRDRLIAHLLYLADERGVRTDAGTEIALDENNEQLAARLGTVRELVSRNLGRLHGEGLIKMRKRAVTIPDKSTLRAAIEN